ncbi:dihydrolipoamide acetyltransferase family protein [Caldisericum sp.]|jgi:pyruvate dehydrogenase E2 component (dihydrolipoamide acetyltransferase)|uniref:dihydrolipoamide acetyltransferase family protein n=1 Tax=Caldisericum sp. TaxID=2499687 RepID=UPI003D112CDF
MPEIIIMPQLGMTMEKGTITKWHKSEGSSVVKGEVLLEVLTDKANMDIESPVSGIVYKILFKEGEEVDVGKPIAVIKLEKDSEEDLEKLINELVSDKSQASPKEKEKSEEINIKEIQSKEKYIPATPYAKKLASENNLDLHTIERNKSGFVSSQEVKSSLDKQSIQPINLTPIVKAMSSKMEESVKIPQFTLYYEIKADNLIKSKYELEKRGLDASLTIIIAKVIAEVIKNYEIFSYYFKEGMLFKNVGDNVGIAVATDSGLLVPVLKGLTKKSFKELINDYKSLVFKAKNNKLDIDDIEGGAYTISNLGMFGVDFFRALLVPNQSAIFAISSIKDSVFVQNGGIHIGKVMNLSISCDHRFIDGSKAAGFMMELKKVLEEDILEEIGKWQ